MSAQRSHAAPGLCAALGIRAVVLLAGRVGRDPLADGAQRAVLGLPVGGGRALLDLWEEHCAELAGGGGADLLDVHVAVNDDGVALPAPAVTCGRGLRFSLARDSSEYRGTAGVVRDLTRGFAPGDLVLVITANQVLREPIADVVRALAEAGEGVSVVPGADGEVASMFLLRSSRLDGVPAIGFVDLKEQALAPGRGDGPLHVTRRAAWTALPVRRLAGYIRALRVLHSAPPGSPGAPGATPDGSAAMLAPDPFAESWRSVFSIVEPRATVDDSAMIQDSVVLAGGVVGAGAAVVRSVVCPGGVVRPGAFVADAVVRGGRA